MRLQPPKVMLLHTIWYEGSGNSNDIAVTTVLVDIRYLRYEYRPRPAIAWPATARFAFCSLRSVSAKEVGEAGPAADDVAEERP
jgi:hypothetical protein